MTEQIVRRSTPVSTNFPEELHPLLARLYAQRGVESAAELERSLDYLLPYQQLSGIDTAVKLLVQALTARQRILIVGDFDADGATSCAVAVRALRMMGAAAVDYLVPNRFDFGYGLTPEIVAVAASRQPDLVMTVDNGIASLDGVQAARALGIKVIITDHHLPGAVLPSADAIVNPNQPGDTFPSKHLAGVGVIFYVMLALRAALRELGWFAAQGIEQPNLARLLDLVALGTVADVVTLDHNNRILVGQGLARIRRGQASTGMRALINVSGRDARRLVAADLGFALGPRLNAAGRLEDMSLGIECLLCDDELQALAMAHELDRLNRERRVIEARMKEQALEQLADHELEMSSEAVPYGLCLFNEHWHQGVIGILASRIRERWHRPVIVFARAGDGQLKGSARSVPGLHIRDVLDAVASRHPGLVSKFGGHAMAAGLSLAMDKLPAFSKAFDEEVRHHLCAEDLRGVIISDGELAADCLTIEVAELLRSAGPWGQGFPEPVFDGRFVIHDSHVVADAHLKLWLRTCSSMTPAAPIEAIMFNAVDRDIPEPGTSVHVVYRLDVNDFRGKRHAQLIIEHLTIKTA